MFFTEGSGGATDRPPALDEAHRKALRRLVRTKRAPSVVHVSHEVDRAGGKVDGAVLIAAILQLEETYGLFSS